MLYDWQQPAEQASCVNIQTRESARVLVNHQEPLTYFFFDP